MSFPNIPNVTPSISVTREEVVNLLLASIAFEELGLAHIINAEAEKIQAVLGTLPGAHIPPVTNISDLLLVNQAVNKTLKTVIKKEMLLQFKLEEILENLPPSTSSSSTTTTTTTTTSTTTSTTTTSTTVAAPLYLFGDVASAAGSTDGTTVTGADTAYYHARFQPVFNGYSFTETPIIGVLQIPQPSITVEKQVSIDGGASWDDADVPIGPELTSGKAWFRIIVSNNGNVPLNNVTITDPSLGLVTILSALVNGSGVIIIAQPA